MSEQQSTPLPVRKYRKRPSAVPYKPPLRASREEDEDGAPDDTDRMCQSAADNPDAIERFVLDLGDADRAAYAALLRDGETSFELRIGWLKSHGFRPGTRAGPAGLPMHRSIRQARSASRLSAEVTAIVEAASPLQNDPRSFPWLEQKLTQFLYRELDTDQLLSGVGLSRLSRLVGDAIGHRIDLEKLNRLSSSRPGNAGAALAARRLTCREVAERVRFALLGPDPAKLSSPPARDGRGGEPPGEGNPL